MIAAESLLPTWGDRILAIVFMLAVAAFVWLAGSLAGRGK